MSTLVGQTFDYTSGTGKDQWQYRIIIDKAGAYTARILSTPLGAPNRLPVIDIPESVLEDMVDSIAALQAGGSSSGSSGSTGSS